MTTAAQTKTDIVIIGAGPAGLAMACRMAALGLACTVVEKQPREKASVPADDGREIALTHRSVGLLKDMNVWAGIEKADLGQIRTAHVLNKSGAAPLSFMAEGTGKDRLSYMVPNHVIRRALFEAAAAAAGVTLLFGREVTGVETDADGGTVALDDGRQIAARLVIAADSRMSPARAMLGIATEELDFEKTMILCKLRHEKPHNDTAVEWFQAERTLAMLPLAGNHCSAVLTVPHDAAGDVLALDDAGYAKAVAAWFGHRHGKMTVAGKRVSYPLKAVYAKTFYAPSFILLGDAAVGMHPVTAHGFNFGLRGVGIMGQVVSAAQRRGQDWAAPAQLAHYNRQLRMATRPLYLATNFIATLFTRQGPLSALARAGLHRAARKLPFAQKLISRQLVDAG